MSQASILISMKFFNKTKTKSKIKISNALKTHHLAIYYMNIGCLVYLTNIEHTPVLTLEQDNSEDVTING